MKCESYMLQNVDELADFIALLKANDVHSYLEIGCKFGGSLWRIGTSLPAGSRIVAVDLPHGDTSFKETLPHLQQCLGELCKRGYDAHLVVGDSTAPETVKRVAAFGPFDACFIDGNHTAAYVRRDFENYSKLARLVAFHDIGFHRANGMPPGKKPIEVPAFWNAIKQNYKHVEIRRDKQDNGIGVLWL
jgi:predicted O-methyltransferase YrrM